MYLEVEHVFDAPVHMVEAAMFHPEYPAFLVAHHDDLSGVSPQSLEDDGAQVRRRIHFAPRPAFEHLGTKKVPADWFEFIEESVWDKHEHRLVFDHIPTQDKVRRRLRTRGEIALLALPSGQTRRLARAEIKIGNLPLMLRALGPVAEQLIGREARRMFDVEARVLGEWLRTTQAQA
jgi:hypothetical protein